MLTPDQQQIVLEYKEIAENIAWKYKRKMIGTPCDFRDIEQAAYLGLCKAVHDHPRHPEIPLVPFIIKRIKYTILEFFEQESYFHYRSGEFWRGMKLKDDPREAAVIAKEMGITVQQVTTLRQAIQTRFIGLDAPYGSAESGDAGETIGDLIPDELDLAEDVVNELDRKEKLKDLFDVVQKLSPLQKTAISLRTGIPFGIKQLTLREAVNACRSVDATKKAWKRVVTNVPGASKSARTSYFVRGDKQSFEREQRKQYATQRWMRFAAEPREQALP